MEDQRAAAEPPQDGMVAQEFAGQLRTLRTAAGNPSFRKMAGRSGRISHTTLHEAAAGTRFPSWETTREFVRVCEADEAQWRCRWEDAQRSVTVHVVPDDSRTAAVADSAADSPMPATVDTRPTDVVAPVDEGPRARRHRLPWLAVAAGLVALVAVVGIVVHSRSSVDGSPVVAPSPSSTPFSDSLIPGDSSKFIADVTIPDGMRVKVKTHFVKVWAIANVGTVDWHDRFLARMNPTADKDGCQVPDRVAIGDTPPGQQVMISVAVTAPSRPAECWVSWKMVDEAGDAYFPSRRPVYFMVNVVA
ncbi:NBR1-Ig-like domain-containing protein [Actinoplanes sp. NPDC051411]|uniref:NBR1-Ig-like domain-containing protein n=1 Tax=Actinoplanes sp. NPDC051411 TaxID=3155522 RepID=UPI003445FC28